MIVNEFSGKLPKTVSELCTLPGIGRSTAGAISSIAYKQRASILDGNVKRVLARHRGISGWPGKTATLQALWLEAENLTPATSCDIYSQAMMDLGAGCCSRSSPNCSQCPIADDCHAKLNDCIGELPGKKPKKTLPIKSTRMLVLRHQNELHLLKRPALGIWPSLYSFLEIPLDDDIDTHCIKLLGNGKYQRSALDGFRHSFSHYHLDIHIELINCEKKPQSVMEDSQQLWYNMLEKANVGLAAPVSRIIKSLEAAS
jgi:A/G-specific adenine glycosylase